MKKINYIAFLVFLIGLNFNAHAQLPNYLPQNGLVAWYPFNGNANDESGNGYHGTVNGVTLTTDRFGNLNQAYNFISGNRITSTPDLPIGNSPRSVSVWFKTSSLSYNPNTGLNVNVIVSYGNGPGTIGSGLAGQLEFDTQIGYLVLNHYAVGLGNSAFVSDNLWHNAIYTYDGSTHKLFLDGTQIDEDYYSINTGLTQLMFGGRAAEPNWHNYNGVIDDCAIWNRALTSQEVASVYSGLLPCQNTSGSIATSITEGESYSFNGQSLTTAGTYTATLQNAAGCDSVVTLNLTVNAAPQNCDVAVSDTEICAGETVSISVGGFTPSPGGCSSSNMPANLQQGLVAWYPFCGNAEDESPNNYNGTVRNAVLTSDRFGNANQAYSFTTGQDIIVNGTQGLNLYPMSISLWYNVDTIVSIYDEANIFSKYSPAAWNGYAIITSNMAPEEGNVYYPTVKPWYTRSINNRIIGRYGSAPFEHENIDLDAWHHMVFTVAPDGGKCYVNGQLIATDTWDGTAGPSSSSFIWKIGGLYDYWYNGKIDDIAVYNRVLSAAEATQLYQYQAQSETTSIIWSTGETTAQISVSPTETTTYNVTVNSGDQSCSSVVTITVNQPISVNESASACNNYTWNGNTYSQSGTYTWAGTTAAGCDSIVTLNLTINQPSAATVNATITEGETYSFNGQSLTTAGTYTATLQNAAGCDSSVTLNLTVEPIVNPFNCDITADAAVVCLNEVVNLSVDYAPSTSNTPTVEVIIPRADAFEYSFTLEDNWKTNAGNWSVASAPFGNVTTGDFAYNTFWPINTTLYVRKTINLNNYDLNSINYKLGVDNGFELYVNGNLVAQDYQEGYTFIWEYQGSIPAQFLNQGDNIIALRLVDGGGLTAFDMMLEGLNSGQSTSILWSTGETSPSISVVPVETTTYSVTVIQGEQTCTSEVTITVNQPSAATVNASITEGETYSFNGQNLTTAGTYTATLQNAAGCDSVVTLNLTVNPAPSGCFASSFSNFVQGTTANGLTVSAVRSNAAQALNQPETVIDGVVNFVSLGFGGSITLAFEAPIANGAGADIRIDEATWGNNPCNRYPERADVFASQDGSNFVFLGQVCQDATLDLGVLSWAQYIRIVDASDLLSFSADADGYDVNGVECLNGTATVTGNDGLVGCSLQEIVSYNPGPRKNGTPVTASRRDENKALGNPQNNNTINFVSLGFGGTLVAKFDYVVFNQPGNDLRVTETSFGNPSCTSYPEKARISLSLDNVNWVEVDELCQDGEVDLGSMPYAQYIKIQDASPMSSNRFNGAADGYDVDAVVVLNNGCGATARFAEDATMEETMDFNVYPNPIEDYAIVSISELDRETEFDLVLVDAAGRIVMKQPIVMNNEGYTLFVNDLARGIYTLTLSNAEQLFVKRLVK